MFNGAGMIGGPMPGPGGSVASCPACGAPEGGEGVPLPPAAAGHVAPLSAASAPCDVITSACEPGTIGFGVFVSTEDPNDQNNIEVVVHGPTLEVRAITDEYVFMGLVAGGPYVIRASRAGYIPAGGMYGYLDSTKCSGPASLMLWKA